jgi:polyvinyl alcohol dehydrogenase (cytochrome)
MRFLVSALAGLGVAILTTVLAAQAPAPARTDASVGRCATVPAFSPSSGPQWNGWGNAITNTRFQPAGPAGLTPEQVPKLRLKWALGFPSANSARAQPAVAGGRLFVGSDSGLVYALDAKSGCIVWTFQSQGGVRTGITIAPRVGGTGTVAYFGGRGGMTYAIDASTGQAVWSRDLDTHPAASITGSPVLYQDRLYVPVSSSEEASAQNPKYECCKFRGSLAVLNAANGEIVWQTYVMPEAQVVGKNSMGVARYGPAGAAIWSAPTIDVKRGMVYVATGNQYTEPPQQTANAIIAFDMKSGKIAWVKQATANDLFVMGCGRQGGPNCPAELGPDFDFGNPPILARLPNGREALVVGQKSGVGWAFDPDKQGAVLWQYQAGQGSALGGMEWGSAVDDVNAYFAVADGNRPQAGTLHAVNLVTGQRAWLAEPPKPLCAGGRGCSPALSAAITVIPGVVFAGSMDGGMRAFSTRDGAMIWEFDTNREFQTINGVPAKGASINGPGPAVVGGMLYVNSGYGALGGRPGNVLLAFGLE